MSFLLGGRTGAAKTVAVRTSRQRLTKRGQADAVTRASFVEDARTRWRGLVPSFLHRSSLGGDRTRRNGRGSGEQFLNWLAVFEKVLRAAVKVGERRARVDAQQVIDCGHDILETDVAAPGALGARVGLADHLAHAQPAAEEHHTARIGPVLAAGTGLSDLRRPPELAEHDDQHVSIKPA